ncbi:hypothetical protein [Nonomuraea typhae]|uniref:hypothetical protein n=1 Tax=Nonomuraea typhae TaxID=2603600 RepID=UPI0012F76BB5|nr:hypothetical protein [Nonomuraea typhae]
MPFIVMALFMGVTVLAYLIEGAAINWAVVVALGVVAAIADSVFAPPNSISKTKR